MRPLEKREQEGLDLVGPVIRAGSEKIPAALDDFGRRLSRKTPEQELSDKVLIRQVCPGLECLGGYGEVSLAINPGSHDFGIVICIQVLQLQGIEEGLHPTIAGLEGRAVYPVSTADPAPDIGRIVKGLTHISQR